MNILSYEIILGILLNINVAVIIRLVVGDSPFRIDLHKMKEIPYPPYVESFKLVRVVFVAIILYMGYPASFYITHASKFLLYLLFWCPTILWWSAFSASYFKSCIFLSVGNAMYMICLFDPLLLPLLVWNVFCTYLSLWYKAHAIEDPIDILNV